MEILKKKACLFVFDFLKGNVCTEFLQDLTHNFFTRNNAPYGASVVLPKLKLDFAQKNCLKREFFFNSFHLNSRKIKNKVILRKFPYEFYFV